MTDFYSVLQRAIASLPDGSGPQRRAVYDKARKALLKQLQSFDPPLPSSDVTAQRLALEDAIRKIENEIARQIRTRRAVQGALPAAGTARLAAPSGSSAAPQRPTEPPQPTPEELQARREGQAESITSAVTAATAHTPEPVPEPEPLTPEPTEPQSVDADALANALVPQTEPVPVAPDQPPDEEDAWFDAPQPRRGPTGQSSDDLSFDGDGAIAPLPPRAATREIEGFDTSEPHEADEQSAPQNEPDAAAPAAAPDRRKRSRRQSRREAQAAERAAQKARKQAEEERRKAERRQRKAGTRQKPAKRAAKKASGGRSIVARALLPIIVLALLAGASYAAYTQRATLLAMLDELSQPGESPEGRAPIRAASSGPQKNDDRLPSTLEGEETRAVTTTTVRTTPDNATAGGEEPAASAVRDVTPADTAVAGVASTGTATDAPITPPPAGESSTASDAAPATESVTPPISEFSSNGSQQAVLYEEASLSGEQGSATAGQVEWSMVRQSVSGGEPEPVVRADTRIPGRNLIATLTIRENRDGALPASHLIEIEIAQTGAEGDDPVKSIPGVIMKETEQARGEALRGAAARVSSGLFWVALSENAADRETNLQLLGERDWIDIPILYESGRRAILTLRKGNDGLTSVNAAIQAWSPG